jgi:hypothetical protein
MRPVLALVLPLLLEAQSSLLEIKLIDGGGAVYAPGTRSAGLAVAVSDELGKPVSGAVVSVRLPDDGAGGSFANGLSSEILTTGSSGRATTSPVRWNRISGAVEIQITAVKGRLRAGTVATCEVSASARAKPGASPQPAPAFHRRLPVKWLIVGTIAAAAAAGFATARASGHSASSTGSTSSSGTASSQPVQIGSPSITVGAP